jgi:hypothetical protein
MALGVRYYGRGTRRVADAGDTAEERRFEAMKPANFVAPTAAKPTPPTAGKTITQTLPGGVSYQVQQSPYGSMPKLYEEIPAIVNELVPTGPTLPGSSYVPWPGIGGGTTDTASSELAFNIRKYEEEQDRLRQGNLRAQQEYLRLLQGVPGQYESLGNVLKNQQIASVADIERLFGVGQKELETRRGRAEGLVAGGYEALANYLQRNQPSGYAAPIATQPTQTTNQLAQYLAARGVPQEQVEAEVVKVNQAAVDAQTNYGGLINVLREQEQKAQESRIVEAQLAQQVANAQIQTLYGAGISQLEQEKLQSLASLNERIRQEQFALEQSKVARENALNEALAKLRESGFGVDQTAAEEPTKSETATAKQTPIQQLAAKAANIQNKTLAKDVRTFVAANPNATPAQIRKEFPKLGANITR